MVDMMIHKPRDHEDPGTILLWSTQYITTSKWSLYIDNIIIIIYKLESNKDCMEKFDICEDNVQQGQQVKKGKEASSRISPKLQ